MMYYFLYYINNLIDHHISRAYVSYRCLFAGDGMFVAISGGDGFLVEENLGNKVDN